MILSEYICNTIDRYTRNFLIVSAPIFKGKNPLHVLSIVFSMPYAGLHVRHIRNSRQICSGKIYSNNLTRAWSFDQWDFTHAHLVDAANIHLRIAASERPCRCELSVKRSSGYVNIHLEQWWHTNLGLCDISVHMFCMTWMQLPAATYSHGNHIWPRQAHAAHTTAWCQGYRMQPR